MSGGYLAMMCLYYFVDVGPSALETLVLAPRLILPVVAFLLVGYGAWMHDLAARFGGTRPEAGDGAAVLRPGLAAVLCVLPLVVVTAVSARHLRYQRAMSKVREIASAVAEAYGERTLGVTANACKAGLLHDGPTTLFDPETNRTAAVFCSEVSASHRANTGEHRAASSAATTVAALGRDSWPWLATTRTATPAERRSAWAGGARSSRSGISTSRRGLATRIALRADDATPRSVRSFAVARAGGTRLIEARLAASAS